MGIDLSIIWFVIIVFATLMYIVMDGFDLGIGILFPATPNADDRDVMVNSVAPVWDGNETWLVLGGAALFGAFPLAYAVIIDALTIPLTIMLIGLIFRGVAFEFRFKATPAHRPFWDKAFIGGSIVATFSQGITVGAVIQGSASPVELTAVVRLTGLPRSIFLRSGSCGGLRAVRINVAGNEKRKCPAKADASAIESASAPASGIHCDNQYLDPSRPTSHCCALVYSAESVLSAACSCAGCDPESVPVALPARSCEPYPAVYHDVRAGFSWL